jgi:hypothetical protein
MNEESEVVPVPLEKLTVVLLVNKYSDFAKIRKFITPLKRTL